ncbi:hypothetical protein H3N56_11325 [Cetobacterium sp. 2A]|uniref:hypothetical protein n=1 Tax=Cetobacterium sp. 2A TaxID=2754723 RepID=UPI00163D0989|nr:hypothetical protein [Cetobacterium sp. 2A]MBC2857023.1 hypothetical protein [Cetobacterium sp. 2A]
MDVENQEEIIEKVFNDNSREKIEYFGENRRRVTRYENEEIVESLEYQGEFLDGERLIIYEDYLNRNKVIKIGKYKNGKKEGFFICKDFQTGKIKSLASYREGYLQLEKFYTDNKLSRERIYMGSDNYTEKEFYDDGKVKFEKRWIDENNHSFEEITYYTNGINQIRKIYRDNNKVREIESVERRINDSTIEKLLYQNKNTENYTPLKRDIYEKGKLTEKVEYHEDGEINKRSKSSSIGMEEWVYDKNRNLESYKHETDKEKVDKTYYKNGNLKTELKMDKIRGQEISKEEFNEKGLRVTKTSENEKTATKKIKSKEMER